MGKRSKAAIAGLTGKKPTRITGKQRAARKVNIEKARRMKKSSGDSSSSKGGYTGAKGERFVGGKGAAGVKMKRKFGQGNSKKAQAERASMKKPRKIKEKKMVKKASARNKKPTDTLNKRAAQRKKRQKYDALKKEIAGMKLKQVGTLTVNQQRASLLFQKAKKRGLLD